MALVLLLLFIIQSVTILVNVWLSLLCVYIMLLLWSLVACSVYLVANSFASVFCMQLFYEVNTLEYFFYFSLSKVLFPFGCNTFLIPGEGPTKYLS